MTQLAASSMQNVNFAALNEESMLSTVRLAAGIKEMAQAVEANDAKHGARSCAASVGEFR